MILRFWDLFLLISGPSLPEYFAEFSNEEFRTAEVDPIYQYSKPITVWPVTPKLLFVIFGCLISLNFTGLKLLLQSHMNKDHTEDTRLIVQHATSVPVIYIFLHHSSSNNYYYVVFSFSFLNEYGSTWNVGLHWLWTRKRLLTCSCEIFFPSFLS